MIKKKLVLMNGQKLELRSIEIRNYSFYHQHTCTVCTWNQVCRAMKGSGEGSVKTRSVCFLYAHTCGDVYSKSSEYRDLQHAHTIISHVFGHLLAKCNMIVLQKAHA